ncbi:uncharacterized protein LOC129872627 [Solanum dulcamara]|uniref:uncharacterized protein LOC129872627 n=1 Tax=Solanum dulcamara TaxID=45834 RepID=UPI00248509DC|nr:uncharacterized protein LOC129872627 [Solanum dulcamara]
MELEAVLTLFDSCWFNLEILNKNSNSTPLSSYQKNPDDKIQENSPETVFDSPKLEIQIESQSDDLSYNSDSFSPDSVLQTTHFQPDFKRAELKKVKGRRRDQLRRKRTTKRGLTKSLSELEYEELKGFMDLGFEFSEEDINSSLVNIIPGLQKLRKNRDSDDDQQKVNFFEKSDKSRARPYLSEAWGVIEKTKKMNPLMNWKLPETRNEIDIKHSLKWWAHTVASSVKQPNRV